MIGGVSIIRSIIRAFTSGITNNILEHSHYKCYIYSDFSIKVQIRPLLGIVLVKIFTIMLQDRLTYMTLL